MYFSFRDAFAIQAHRPEPIPGQPERDPMLEPRPEDTPGFPPGSAPGTDPEADEPGERPIELFLIKQSRTFRRRPAL